MRWVFILITFSLQAQTYPAGGLTALATPATSSNLLSNAGFDTGSPPTGWTIAQGFTGFSWDTATFRSSPNSLKFHNATWASPNPSTYQSLTLAAGVYRLGGYWKSPSGFGTQANNIRACIHTDSAGGGGNCAYIYGTAANWTAFELTSINIATPGTYYFSISYYNGDGDIWFDDVYVKRDAYPINVFMKYPNYRGILFLDQAQVMSFDVTVDPLTGVPSDYKTKYVVTDETTSSPVATNTHTATTHEVVTIDATGWNAAHTYLITFSLLDAGDIEVYAYSAYRVIPTVGSQKSSWNLIYNSDNQFLVKGVPTFLIGVYDSSLDPQSTEAAYLSQWVQQRHLDDVTGLNHYQNSWWGGSLSQNDKMLPGMDAAATNGYMYMQGANCVVDYEVDPTFWAATASDADIQARAAKNAFGGWYVADECISNLVSNVFSYRQRQIYLSPGTVTWGALNRPTEFSLWRDTIDVLGTDAYPILTGSANISLQATWTKAAMDAVMSTRPVLSVIQYWGGGADHIWPTATQLRQMAYMSITEGANGISFWEIGGSVGALASASCDGSTNDMAYPAEVAKLGVAYSTLPWWNGHPPPNNWTINSGALPDGLSMDGVGNITGTPTATGKFYINASISGGSGGSATANFLFEVLTDWTTHFPAESATWCNQRQSNWEMLVNLVTELNGIKIALASVDINNILINNTEANIHTRVKYANGKYYLLASNTTNGSLSPTFTWASTLPTITVYNESRTITPSNLTFTDTFTAYASHVYEISVNTNSRLSDGAVISGGKIQ